MVHITVSQQDFHRAIDADCKLYHDKTAITSADMLNERVLPWHESQEIPILRILIDRGTEYTGNIEQNIMLLSFSYQLKALSIPKESFVSSN